MSDSRQQAAAILYVDDEATSLKYFQRAIGTLAPVLTAGSVEEGKRVLDAHADAIAVLVSDQRMPGGHGNELLFYAWERYPHIVRILTTAYCELEQTVDAVNQGQIHRYLQKPWETAALKVEMAHALELARLRKDHAQLLREKLHVRQKQVVSNRIGAVYALCATVAGAVAAEAYLAAALAAGLMSPEPDWILMDYADLISSEAFRGAAFGCAVRDHLARIARRHPDGDARRALDALADEFGDRARRAGAAGLVFLDGHDLAEFLETPTDAAVSSRHALWLACLLWLAMRGATMRVRRGAEGIECALAEAGAPLTPAQLADWIAQF